MKTLLIVIPWVLSATGIYTAWHLGNKTPWIFRVKIANQILWITWVVLSENWGFLPMAITFTLIYIRNMIQWERYEQEDQDQ